MKSIRIIILGFIFSAICALAFGQAPKESAIQAMNTIDYNYFQKHLTFLASDELKGRDTGSEGYALAAEYVTDEFKTNGLLPFGDNQTYYQHVGFAERIIDKKSVVFKSSLNDKTVKAVYGKNITLLSSQKYANVNDTQEIAFVGYGNIIPDENINDYEGIDVKGKTVIIALGGPNGMKNNDFFNLEAKAKNAQKNGATGIILFYPKKALQKIIFKNIHGFISSAMLSLTDSAFSGASLSDDFDFKIAGMAKLDFLEDVFKLNGLKLKKELKNISKGNNSSQLLRSKFACKFDVIFKQKDCKNVVALLPGTDPKLKNEYVVVSAHLDHVGVGKTIKGDSIYNGMWDNATGSAAVLSLSKAIKEMPKGTKRSIIFVCYTGEEKGLLGSKYFASKTKINDGKIVANLNVDMLAALFETTDVIPLGYNHSNLSEAVDYAVKPLNLVVDNNLQEEKEYFSRSDQMSFIQQGVPALNIGNGYTAKNSKINAKKEVDKWMKKSYHSPFDDLNQDYSPEAFLTFMKLYYLATYYTANEMNEIKWNPESKYYKKYVLKEKKVTAHK
ncbi:MAG: M28 family peptidase [Salinivirgaceae bacterium]|nr:M28 family peptidase [Salinivirgaceae bacterium]